MTNFITMIALLILSATCAAAAPPLPQDAESVESCVVEQKRAELPAQACIDTVAGPCLVGEGGQTTVGMEGCFSRSTAVWDAMVGDYYARALARLDEAGRDKLRQVQRAWIAYRDSLCELERLPAEDGTLGGVLQASCVHQYTAERALALRAFYEAWFEN